MYWNVTIEASPTNLTPVKTVVFTDDGARPTAIEQRGAMLSARVCWRKPYAATDAGWRHHLAMQADMRARLERFTADWSAAAN